MRRCARVAALASLALALCACTTTVVRHGPDMQPVTRNSSPDAMSELRIAETALDSGNLELAKTLFNRVLEHDQNSVAALTGLGNTLYAVGDDTRAGVYYERASKIDGAAFAPLIGLGRVAIHQRRFDDAIATYRQVLARAPSDPVASAGLAVALDLKGDHPGAQTVLRNALKANPGDPMLSIDLGLSLVLAMHAKAPMCCST
jgi:tetratricopeptide (TPR) repeat protein